MPRGLIVSTQTQPELEEVSFSELPRSLQTRATADPKPCQWLRVFDKGKTKYVRHVAGRVELYRPMGDTFILEKII